MLPSWNSYDKLTTKLLHYPDAMPELVTDHRGKDDKKCKY